MIILFGVVALEGCFLIKYFTRFTEDIFELLISAIFIYEPIALLYKVSIGVLGVLWMCVSLVGQVRARKKARRPGQANFLPGQVTFKFTYPMVKSLSKSSSN